MLLILAASPILLILVLMVGLRWGASRAGALGYLSALAIAALFFGAGAELLAYAHARALLLSVDVLLIVWAAFLFYRVAEEAGAIRSIGRALPHLTSDPAMQALLNGWVFASFLQGVGGFGVPVAVIAPLLVGLGFPPIQSAVMASVGHAWGVTFGSLGSAFQALMAASGMPGNILAPPAAIFLGLAGMVGGWMVAYIAGGSKALLRFFWPVALLGLIMGTSQLVAASLGLWNMAAFIGAICGLLAVLPLARRYPGEHQPEGGLDLRGLLVATSGYGILLVVILCVQLIPAVGEFLSRIVIKIPFPEVRTAGGFVTPAGYGRMIAPFSHTGIVLVYVSILSYLVYWKTGQYTPGAFGRILGSTLKGVLGSSVGILSMVTMAVLMENSGMTDTLARGLANGVSGLFPVVAPWIGAVGAFMTGSNTNSNVLFVALQVQTAQLLGYAPATILAGQTAGAALASVIAPTKILVGASTTGLAGKEGLVMRSLAVYIGILVLFISLLTGLAVLLK
jgi:lactate permease